MVRRKQGVTIIVLRCVIFGYCASAQQAAFGTGIAIPPKSAIGGYVLVAQADMPVEPQAAVQETKNTDASAEPQAVMREIKSVTHLSSSKQRRRKPKMADVPAGLQTVAQETKEPESQVAAQETKEPESQVAAQETKKPESQAAAQETKKPESQVVAQETEEIDTTDNPLAVTQQTKNVGTPTEPPAEVTGLKATGIGKKRYGMAPIRWGVSLSETVSLERHSQTMHLIDINSLNGNLANGSGRSRGLVHTQTAEIQAKTYVLQPYIAQLGGNLGVVSSKRTNSFSSTSSFNGTISPNGVNNLDSGRNNQLFGNGDLSLFSQSRFPFNMSLGVSDRRDSEGLITNDTLEKQLSLSQSYRPLRSTSLYDVGYMRNTVAYTAPAGVATHSYWRGSYSTRGAEHKIKMDTIYNDKLTSPRDNMDRRMNDFTVSDRYLPIDSLLSLNSFANLYSSVDNTAGSNSSTRYLQANTSANWQPEDEDIPLFVDGNVRLFKVVNTNQGVAIPVQSLGLNVGASYRFSKNLSGRADSSVTSTSLSGIRNLITTQRGSVTYSSNAIKLWKNSSYSWSANGGAANQTQTDSSNGQSVGSDSSVFGGGGHSLSVPYSTDIFGKKWQINSHVNQSLNTIIGRVNGQNTTLINAGRVSLAPITLVRPSKEMMGVYGNMSGLNANASLSVNDSRTIGKNPTHSRIYMLMLNETSNAVYSRSGLEVGVSLGAVQGTVGNSIALIGTSTAKYTKSRVFNVRGLDYSAAFSISGQSNQGASANRIVDANANNPKFPWSLDQNLKYKIGQNEVMLRGRISDQYGMKDASLWLLFRAWRTVGY